MHIYIRVCAHARVCVCVYVFACVCKHFLSKNLYFLKHYFDRKNVNIF